MEAEIDRVFQVASNETELWNMWPSLADGCSSILSSVVYRTVFYMQPLPMLPMKAFAQFTQAVCSLPYTFAENSDGIREYKLAPLSAENATAVYLAGKVLLGFGPDKMPARGARVALTAPQSAILANYRLAVCPEHSAYPGQPLEESIDVSMSERVEAVQRKLLKLTRFINPVLAKALNTTGFGSFARSYDRCANLASVGFKYT